LEHHPDHFVRIFVQTPAVGASSRSFCTNFRTNLGRWSIIRIILYEFSYKLRRLGHHPDHFVRIFLQTPGRWSIVWVFLYEFSYKPRPLAHHPDHFVRIFLQTPGRWSIIRIILYEFSYKLRLLGHHLGLFVRIFVQTLVFSSEGGIVSMVWASGSAEIYSH
jgi:hypothetical protein